MRRAIIPLLFILGICCLLAPVAWAKPNPTPSRLAERALVLPSNVPNGHNDTVICVYPISGQYGLLPRLLYYVSLVLGILGRYQRWLVMGALASALSYAGATSIHMIAMIKSRKPVFDLDILAAWAVLTTGCVAFAALVHWSSALRRSEGRIVIVIWGGLVGVGCLVGRALLIDVHSDAEPACRSSAGELLTSNSDLLSAKFNCTYKCFSARIPMRQPKEITAIPTDHLLGTYANFGTILLVPILSAVHKSVSYNLTPHTPSQACTSVVMLYLNTALHTRLSQSTYNAACETWYGGYILLFQYLCSTKVNINFKRRVLSSLLAILMFIDLLFDLAALPLFVTNIILNELNLVKTDLPTEETYSSVGQWSPVVSAVLVLFATAINQLVVLYKTRQRSKKHPPDPEPGTATQPESSVATQGYSGVQESGVVLQKLTPQETLRVDSDSKPK